MQSTRLMKRAKLSDAHDAEALRVAAPEKDRGEGGAGEPDQAKAGNRHALAALAERLRDHGGAARQDDDDDRDDGGEFAHLLGDRSVVRDSSFVVRRARFGVRGSGFAVRCTHRR